MDPRMMSFSTYLALGDSISIDLYPALDLGASVDGGLGAASLLYRNRDDLYPAFRGRDLLSIMPGVRFRNLTADGATTSDVVEDQVVMIQPSDEEVLVTITAGGNDMLQLLGSPIVPSDPVDPMIGRVRKIVAEVKDRLPRSTILLGTVYDPSDGTNVLDGRRYDREARWLARVNAAVRSFAEPSQRITIADIHLAFLGHGMTVPPPQRWYWSGLIFEPSAIGASEVRRIWLESLGL